MIFLHEISDWLSHPHACLPVALPACRCSPPPPPRKVSLHAALPQPLSPHLLLLLLLPLCSVLLRSWFDLDLSTKPYRALRYHNYAASARQGRAGRHGVSSLRGGAAVHAWSYLPHRVHRLPC